MRSELQVVSEIVALLLLERKTLRSGQIHFVVVHRFREPGTDCAPGEEVFAVLLAHRTRQYPLRMSGSQRLLFDYLSRSRIAQTASQIFAGMSTDPFYRKHGSNATTRAGLTTKVSLSCMREYVRRLRMAIGKSSRDARLLLDPYQILVSEKTSSNCVGYRLRAHVEWIHVDHPMTGAR